MGKVKNHEAEAYIHAIESQPDGFYAIGRYYPSEAREDYKGQPLRMRLGEQCPAPIPELVGNPHITYHITYCLYGIPAKSTNRAQRPPEIKSWSCMYVSPGGTRRARIYSTDQAAREVIELINRDEKAEQETKATLGYF